MKDGDLEEEMRGHIEERAAELMREGMSEQDARHQARREFGNLTALAEKSRDVWRWPALDELWRTVAHAARSLRRGGAYTVVSIVTLALGIGVNTAIFSVIDAALLRGLPYQHPERLVRAGIPMMRFGAVGLTPEFVAWRNENRAFTGLVAWNDTQLTLTGAGDPERVTAAQVSADFLSVLGVNPAVGRDLRKNDDRSGAAQVAIVSDALWRRHWNGDRSVVGRAAVLDNAPVTIVGVLPPDFLFPGDMRPDLLVPAQLGDQPEWSAKGVALLKVTGRLKPGVTPEMAAADLDRVFRAHQSDRPAWLERAQKGAPASVEPLETSLTNDVRPALMALICAVGVVLLIACANVASLQLSRFNGRIRELGVRAALGASKAQLLRLVLAESLLVSATGAVVGCAGAYFLIRAARPYYRMLHLASPDALTLNGEVALFSIAVTIGCAMVFALGPAALVGQVDAQRALRADGVRAASGLRNAFRSLLVTGEMALAVILLLGAGLLLRSFARLISVDRGFETRGVLTASMTLPNSRYSEDGKIAAFVDDLMARLGTAPGLISAGAASSPPFTNYNMSAKMYFEGRPAPPMGDESQSAPVIAVTPGYFKSLGISILEGRGFSDSDADGHPRVAVVNAAFVQQYFPNQDPVGRRIGWQTPATGLQWWTIAGVVAGSRHEDLSKPAIAEVFAPFDQLPLRRVTVTLRAAVPPASLAAFVRAQVLAVDREQPLYDVSTMEERVNRTLRDRRVETLLLGSFAALALVLAAAGVYGVMSYSVSQSRREIGVRMALGATPGAVTGEVLKRALGMSIAGLAAGLVASWFLTRFLAGFLYGVGAKDPVIFSLAPVSLLTIALVASYLPARRAARVDPVEALRAE